MFSLFSDDLLYNTTLKHGRLLFQASMHCLRESLVPVMGRVTDAVSVHTSPSAHPHLCRSYREINVMRYS